MGVGIDGIQFSVTMTHKHMSQGKFNEKLIKLRCSECKHSNYTTRKNKKTVERKIEYKKFCPWCQKHTPHKEGKK